MSRNSEKHLYNIPLQGPKIPIGAFPSWGLGNYPIDFFGPSVGMLYR
jgi:hypothetical protein